jgi:hypothetical protein
MALMNDYAFILSPSYRVRRHLVFWSVYFLFTLVTYMHGGLEQIGFIRWEGMEVCEVLSNMLVEIPCCYIILYFLVPAYLMKKKYLLFIAGCTALFLLSAGMYYLDHLLLAHRIHAFFGLVFTNPEYFYSSLINLLIFFPIPISIALTIKMLKTWYISQQQHAQLREETAAAEMRLLNAQIQPHFLFNTLNNIYSFSLYKSPRAAELAATLSHTMEYMILECQEPLVQLEKELNMIMNYFTLEKARYGNRIRIQTDIKGNPAFRAITPLLMIPFAENCFKHGSSKMTGTSWIELSIEITDKMLYFTLVNSKPDVESTILKKPGIGLENVKKRLRLLYPDRHRLVITDAEDRFIVEMHVPLFNSLSTPRIS